MTTIVPSSGISRRTLVSTLAALPVLSGTFFSASAQAQTAAGDPLPSWNDGATKQSIINFVTAVTRTGSPDFVPLPQRVATFDNDGTLWCEHPMYVQLAFVLDRVKAMAPLHPEWKDKQPFKAVLDGDMKTLAESGEHGLVELITVTHAGMTTNEFLKIVTDWLATAQHPRFKRPYTELVYQPMLELLAHLRANGFKTFIVSGGGVEFMRPWSERVYGVPPEQVVGTSIKTQFKMREGRPELFRLPEINFIDDKAGKPVGINEYIGRRPIAAFGNSDGDLEMLQWTTMSGGVRLGLIVHHTDAEREYAYDRNTSFGRLDKALDAAAINKWTVVDMKRDWKVIFPFEKIQEGGKTVKFGNILLLLGCALVGATMLTILPAVAQQKPNVIFILADNVGYGDLGSYGGGELRGAPTARLDEMARDGLRFTQFLVEPACTPSRAALMTAQYSIRNGLSLIAVEGSTNTLSARAFTMGDMFKSVGYATAIFGKWHLGGAPQSLPTAHGFDEFYGIPPDISWDAATYTQTIALTHSINEPYETLLKTGPQIVEAKAGGPLQTVKSFTEDVRANIDNDLVDKSIDFMRRQKAAGKPFFLYLPFSMGHFPNLPSQQFKGKSRIGNYGDKLMEGDYHVGQILDTLKQLGIDDNTIVVFASDNGPQGQTAREHGNQGTPDMGSSGPFRGELGEATEGAIRTAAIIRWPGHIKPNTTTYAMFSIMDFLPTFANIVGGKMPTDRPIDGVDQTDVLLGNSAMGHRESLLSFIGADLVAVRWKQWRIYFTDVHPTGIGPQRQPGMFSSSAPMAGYPKTYNIEMDPHEDLINTALFGWITGPALKAVEEYLASVKKYPNPPPPNITQFRSGG